MSSSPAPGVPAFKAPGWYHGLWPPHKLAATIRDAEFAFLGSLEGFPYDTTVYNNAYVAVTFSSPGKEVPAPIQVTVSLIDLKTKTYLGKGDAQDSDPGTPLEVDVKAVYKLSNQYAVIVDYLLPVYSPVPGGSMTFGPVTGDKFQDSSNPFPLEVVVPVQLPGVGAKVPTPTGEVAGKPQHHQRTP